MSLNTRLNKNVVLSKFLDLVKEADDGGLLKSIEYVQLEQLMSENLPKNNVLFKLVNKLITDSTSFTLQELDRYNEIVEQENKEIEENSEVQTEQLTRHLNLMNKQKEMLESELLKLFNYELDDELAKDRTQLNELKTKLSVLFEEIRPLLTKKYDAANTQTKRLDQQLMERLDKLMDKRLQVDELIEEMLMHVDLNLNRDQLVKLIEREYCLKLIEIKNLLESLKAESELILKLHRDKLMKNTIWKVYLKDFAQEVQNEENLISSDSTCTGLSNQHSTTTTTGTEISTNENYKIDFNDFKEYLNLSRNDALDELLLQTKNALKSINES